MNWDIFKGPLWDKIFGQGGGIFGMPGDIPGGSTEGSGTPPATKPEDKNAFTGCYYETNVHIPILNTSFSPEHVMLMTGFAGLILIGVAGLVFSNKEARTTIIESAMAE